MFEITSSGSYKNTEKLLSRMASGDVFNILGQFGAIGVAALAGATPVDTGATSSSWSYTVEKKRGSYTITWTNSEMAGDTPVAILLQLGHGTGTGGYVQGRDYINPAIKPVFDRIEAEAWKAVTS